MLIEAVAQAAQQNTVRKPPKRPVLSRLGQDLRPPTASCTGDSSLAQASIRLRLFNQRVRLCHYSLTSGKMCIAECRPAKRAKPSEIPEAPVRNLLELPSGVLESITGLLSASDRGVAKHVCRDLRAAATAAASCGTGSAFAAESLCNTVALIEWATAQPGCPWRLEDFVLLASGEPRNLLAFVSWHRQRSCLVQLCFLGLLRYLDFNVK